ARWVGCRPGFFLPIRVLSRLFRRLFLEALQGAFEAGELSFFGDLTGLAEPDAFAEKLRALRQIEWVVYAKPPFGGPAQVLAYLSRYTHRVAISNSRITEISEQSVTFRWKDYRHHGKTKLMTLDADEFIRRFLQHTLPDGFHRIRHYGVLANGHRAAKITLCRKLLAVPSPGPTITANVVAACSPTLPPSDTCPCCGGMMITLVVTSGPRPLRRPTWYDTS
ncbi:IS91 family transposase, partial [Acidocella aquatica]